MPDTPIFQDHHIIEKRLADHDILKLLAKHGLFNMEGPENRLYLPADTNLAQTLGVSPHNGSPLGEYSKSIDRVVKGLRDSDDYIAGSNGDPSALERMATRVRSLQDTYKVGLINGDLMVNTPLGSTPEATNANIAKFVANEDGYNITHTGQIGSLRQVSDAQARWAPSLKEQTRIDATLDALTKEGTKAAKGPAVDALEELAGAIALSSKDGAVAPSTISRLQGLYGKFGILGKGLAVAGTLLDVMTSSAEAAEKAQAGNREAAANTLTRLAARLYFGWQGMEAGAAVGATAGWIGAMAGGLIGSILGTAGGEDAVNTIWAAAKKISDALGLGTAPGTPVFTPAGKVYRDLITQGVPKEQAQATIDALNKAYANEIAAGRTVNSEDMFNNVFGAVKDGRQIDPSYRISYDTKGRKTSETQFKSDGSRTDTNMDPANIVPWSRSVYTYNNAGKLTNSIVVADNGMRWETAVDAANEPWSKRVNIYNPGGQVIHSTSIFDDGRRSETDIDPADIAPWSTGVYEYNANGEMTRSNQIADDGTCWETNVDTAHIAPWVKRVDIYNSAKQILHSTVVADDGTRVEMDVDPGNTAAWSKGIYTYDTADRMTHSTQVMDDGTRYETDFDPSNASQAWSQGIRVYNGQSQMVKETIVLDDGSRRVADFDPANASPAWSQGIRIYNANGQMTQETIVTDDNTRIITDLDPTNADPNWSRGTRTYNPNGKMTHETIVTDSGARTETDYNPSTGKATSTHRFNPDGSEIKKPQVFFEPPKIFTLSSFEILKRRQASIDASTAANTRLSTDIFNKISDRFTNVNNTMSSIAKRPDPVFNFNWIGGDGGDPSPGAAGPKFVYSTWSSLELVTDSGNSRGPFRDDHYDSGSVVRYSENGHITVYNKEGEILGELDGGPTDIGHPPSTSPILLDINHDNHLALDPLDLSAPSAPHFDWNADGAPDRTAWVGPADGLLVIDLAKDGAAGPDGVIHQPKEIAFALWKTEKEIAGENGKPVTDLEGLRFAFDTNHDNVFDTQDARWNEFRVWRDANQNGVSEDGELMTMSEAGIKLINLLPDPEGAQQFPDGSAITGTTTALMADGTTMLVGDVSLRFQPSAPPLQMA